MESSKTRGLNRIEWPNEYFLFMIFSKRRKTCTSTKSCRTSRLFSGFKNVGLLVAHVYMYAGYIMLHEL
jgi:hypothetical protein